MIVSRKGFISIPLLAFIAAAAIGLTAEPKAPCTVLSEWAEANAATLPHTYDGFASYDKAHRKAIYTRLTVGEKVEFWTTHLTRILHEDTTLTVAQREYINETIKGLPVYLDGQAGRRAIKLDRMERRALDLFGKARATALFAAIGPKITVQSDVAPEFQNCDCTFGAEISGCGALSCSSPSCNGVFGCGWLGCAWCDGLCGEGET